jgi:hypothetical protein
VNVVPSTALRQSCSRRCVADVVWTDRVFAVLERHDTWLDVEVAAELLPHRTSPPNTGLGSVVDYPAAS